MERRKVVLRQDAEERVARVTALTLGCPFCGASLGSLAGGAYEPGMMCTCGAVVHSVTGGPRWDSAPGALADAYREIRTRVVSTVQGHEDAIARLSLMAARHLHLGGRQRALVIGPSGTGKTTLAVALAEALDCPLAIWDVSVSSEAGWAGVDLAVVMAELYEACDGSLERMSRSILVLDEADKIAVGDTVGVAKAHKRGQQKSLLAVLGGGVPTRFQADGDRGSALAVRTDDMMILGLGAFEGLRPDPSPSDLVAYGYMVELASRFPVIVSLSRLQPAALMTVLERAAAEAIEPVVEFGFDIRVTRPAVRYAVDALERGDPSLTTRAAIGWLQAAVDAVLLKLLDLGAPVGTRYEITPDDVAIPRALRAQRPRG